MIDINLLPPEYRPHRWALPLAIGLILVILALGYSGYGLAGKKADADNDVSHLETQLEAVADESEAAINDPIIQGYLDDISEAEAELDLLKAMQQDFETFQNAHVDWWYVLQTVRGLAPKEVSLKSVEQDGNEFTVGGETTDAAAIVDYAQGLRDTAIFSHVAFEISTEEEDEIIITTFSLLLEVKPGGEW